MSKHVECDLCGKSISTYWRSGGGHVKVKRVRTVSVSRGDEREVQQGDYHDKCWQAVVSTARANFGQMEEPRYVG